MTALADRRSLKRTALADRRSLKRTASLTRWNAVLLTRNRLAFFYAVVLPLLPLALLLTGERGSPTVGAGAIVTMSLTIALFPVFYNVLSQFVNRRDELVLKRMRTGEARDAELLVMTAWTRNAEAAQLTSLPIILLTSVGPMTSTIPDMPDRLRDLLSLTPGAAISDLVRIGWFGLDGPGAEEATLTFAETWSQAAQPLLIIGAWTCVAVVLARRSMRREPRA